MMRVLCFGELLLRFSPALDREWINQQSMPVYIGGAELNTATALATWQIPVSYCTAIPENYLSAEIIDHLNDSGIDTTPVIFSGHRIGSYYLPQGTDLKGAGVIYDRQYSSFWELKPGQVNWDHVLKDIKWLHFSAICPALNNNTAAICLEAVKAASERNITVSIDLNYRAKLWNWGKDPRDILPAIVQYANIIMGNIWAAEKMLDIPVDKDLIPQKENFIPQAKKSSRQIQQTFPSVSQIANTFRFDNFGEIQYYTTLTEDEEFYVSTEYISGNIIDRVGSGDCFMAGLIYGNIMGLGAADKLNFATAAAFNKMFIRGDATRSTANEILKMMDKDS